MNGAGRTAPGRGRLSARLAVLAGLGILLVAAAALDGGLFWVPADTERGNRLVWERLGADEREAARAAWRRVQDASGPRRERLVRRMATLGRVHLEASCPSCGAATEAELRRALERLPERIELHMARPVPEGHDLTEQVRRLTERRVLAFLDNLVDAGRLEPVEHERILRMERDERVEAALELQKREQIFLYAEAQTRPSEPNDILVLKDLEPLDVIETLRQERRKRGFLGRASRALGLTDRQRNELLAVPDEELAGMLRAMMVPKVREHLEARDVDPAEIEAILEKPYRVLERYLNRFETERARQEASGDDRRAEPDAR